MDIAYMKTSRESTNDTDSDNVDFIKENPEIAIPYLILISAFALGGTIGNGMVIASVLTYKPLRTIGNIFVVNLALADFSLTSFVDPFSIVGIIKGEVWFEEHAILCSVIGIICLESCFCSLLSIMVISIDRYVHICKNQKYRDIFTKRRAIMICIGIWILCLILQIPSRFGWIDYKYDLKNLGCVADRTHPSPYYYIAYATAVTLPTTAIIWCYFQIFSYARKCKKMVKNVSKNGSSEKDNSLQLAKTLCIIFIVFATCWTPYTTLAIADRGDVLPLPVHLFGILIAHMNSSVNCLIYGLTNKQFNIAYKKLLGLDKRGKNKSMKSKMHSETSTSTSDTSISHI